MKELYQEMIEEEAEVEGVSVEEMLNRYGQCEIVQNGIVKGRMMAGCNVFDTVKRSYYSIVPIEDIVLDDGPFQTRFIGKESDGEQYVVGYNLLQQYYTYRIPMDEETYHRVKKRSDEIYSKFSWYV